MLCAISGESPQQPVASRKSGTVFEKRLIEKYIAEHGSDPVNGEELSHDDLIELKSVRGVTPRPPTLTSIPALLSTFQHEWDAVVLEAFQLKQQLAETRQELSTAFYYNDAAQRVIARLQKERDEARAALSKVTVTADTNGTNGEEAMQVDGQRLPEDMIAKIEQMHTNLSRTRRKRPVPEDWATGDDISKYDVNTTVDTQFTGAKCLAVDSAGDFFLCGDSDGDIGVFDLNQTAFVTRSQLGAGAVLSGAWAQGKAVVATATGSIVISEGGNVQAKIHQHAGAAHAVDVHPSVEIIASAGIDKSYVLYELSSGRVLTQIFSDCALSTIAFHPDGLILAVGGSDGTMKLHDVKTGALMHTFDASTEAETPVQSIAFSENGTWVASVNAQCAVISLWDLRKLELIKTFVVGSAVSGLAWDYTGQFLAACGPGGVTVFQYAKSTKTWSEPLRKAIEAEDVRWSAKAKALVVLTKDGNVSVLSTPS